MNVGQPRRWSDRLWVRLVLFSAAYLFAAWLGRAFSFNLDDRPPAFVTFWPPAGLLVGVLLMQPVRLWGWFFVAALPSHLIYYGLYHHTPLWVNFLFFLCAAIEALVGAGLIRRLNPGRFTMLSVREVSSLMFFSAVFSTALGALIGAGVSSLADARQFLPAWQIWWAADALGVIVFAPLLIVLLDYRIYMTWPRRKWHWQQVVVFSVVFVFLVWYVFQYTDAFVYLDELLILLVLLRLAVLTGPIGAVLGVLYLALVVVYQTMLGVGDLAILYPSVASLTTALLAYLGVPVFIVYAMTAAIAERQRVFSELMESKRQYEFLIENQGEGIGIVDADEKFLFCNRAAEQIFGVGVGQLVGRNLREFLKPNQLMEVLQQTQKRRAGESSEYELEIRRPDGQARWLLVTATPRFDETGAFTGTYGVFRDITSRKFAEEVMRQNEQLFKQFFELSPIGVAVTSLEGRYLYVNRRLCDALGYSEQELLRLSYEDVSYRDEAELQKNRELRQALLKGEISEFEIEKRFVRKSGEVLCVILRVTLVCDSQSTPLYYIGQFLDITERKKLEAEVLLAQRMAGLGTLAGGVAHEINTPLQIIVGSSETLIKRLREGVLDNDKLLRGLERINQSAWRVAEIIRSLMMYAHPSADVRQWANLNDVIRDTLLLMEYQLKSWSNVTVQTDLAADLPQLYCERGQISQMLINLLNNAHDAIPQGGEIILRTQYDAESRCILLQVSDDGEGIPPQIRDKIFDPFFTTKEVGKGTGLGLSIVAGIVKAHSGKISVESAPGRGTTITVSFTQDVQVEEAERTARQDDSAGRYDGG
ncbi:MAG: PAS domain S-box protein [Anaerolineae bacterium]|nr:PAS domain S-box protein [Anaerolineae bacterium]